MARAHLVELGRRARSAARTLAVAGTASKDAALGVAADLLEARLPELLARNAVDVERAAHEGLTEAQVDRLRLSDARVAAMAAGLRQVAGLRDPVGEVVEGWVRPNGLRVERVRVPLGVVGVIYENRPNVTSDAAGLCLKAGNAVMLRGSSSALQSNMAVTACLRDALAKVGLPEDAVVLVEDTSRETAVEFMQLDGLIDCLIPRGGHSLIASVREHATVPCVIDGDGNCHVYVDAAADLDMAGPTGRSPAWSCAATSAAARSCPAWARHRTRTTPPSSWPPSCRWPWWPISMPPSTTSPASGRGTPRPSSPGTWWRPSGSAARSTPPPWW
jgi:glutamate-5-semialdehyde dehydrogenase